MRKKLMNLIIWNTFKVLPNGLKHKLIRSQFNVTPPEGVYSEIEYKLAETQEEIEKALSLVQESYMDSKLGADDNTMLRISKFNLLPTTIIFIAKYRGEIIATVSQIMDTSLGLPVDSFTDINHLRADGKKISEISCLAIKKEWRSRSTGIFFPLTSYTILYCRDILGIDYAVMVTRASVRHFYTALYGFKPIEDKIKKFSKVNHKASFAQTINLNTLNNELKLLYVNKPLYRNLYKLSINFPWRCQCDFSRKEFNVISNRHFTIEELENLFQKNPSLNKNISFDDRRNLASIYFYKNFAQVFSLTDFHFIQKRKHPRFKVNMKIESGHNRFNVVEVSKEGFCIIGAPQESLLRGVIYLNNEICCEFIALRCWDFRGRVGFKFEDISSFEWSKMIDFSEQYILGNSDSERNNVA